jgi:hypothetical protein
VSEDDPTHTASSSAITSSHPGQIRSSGASRSSPVETRAPSPKGSCRTRPLRSRKHSSARCVWRRSRRTSLGSPGAAARGRAMSGARFEVVSSASGSIAGVSTRAWQSLRVLRAQPPGGVNSDERRAVFTAALEQSEQLMRAARDVGYAARPLPLFYSLSQAGRAIAAAVGWSGVAARSARDRYETRSGSDQRSLAAIDAD